MKKILFIVSLTSTIFINAQTSNHAWGIGLNLGTKDYRGDGGSGILFNDVNLNPGLRIARYLSPSFDMGLSGSFGRYDFTNTAKDSSNNLLPGFRTTAWDANINMRYKFNNGYILKENSLFQPFVTVGMGYANFMNRKTAYNNSNIKEGGINIPLGVGLNVKMNKRWAVSLMSTYNFNNVDKYDNLSDIKRNNDKYLHTSIGVVYHFGKEQEKDSDRDGVADDKDKCLGTERGVKADKDGCAIIAPTTLVKVREIASKIYFETNSDILKEASKKELDGLVEILKLNAQIKIDIEGHTDNVGAADYNMELSQKRASAVRQYLIEKGLAPDRIIAKGYGQSKPVVSNDTIEGKAQNRRVELILHY